MRPLPFIHKYINIYIYIYFKSHAAKCVKQIERLTLIYYFLIEKHIRTYQSNTAVQIINCYLGK